MTRRHLLLYVHIRLQLLLHLHQQRLLIGNIAQHLDLQVLSELEPELLCELIRQVVVDLAEIACGVLERRQELKYHVVRHEVLVAHSLLVEESQRRECLYDQLVEHRLV